MAGCDVDQEKGRLAKAKGAQRELSRTRCKELKGKNVRVAVKTGIEQKWLIDDQLEKKEKRQVATDIW